MPLRSRVIVGDAFVEKCFPASALAVEYEKQCGVWDVLKEFSGVDVPRPVELMLHEGRIRSTRVPADGTLATLYRRWLCGRAADDEFLPSLENAARSLAALHRRLTLSTKTEWTAPREFREAAAFGRFQLSEAVLRNTPQAFLHCDFGFANLYDRTTASGERRLVLYDPSPNEHTTFAADQHGSILLDLGCLFASLNGRFPIHDYPRVRWERVATAKRRFVDRYRAESGWDVDENLAEAVGYATAFASLSRWRGRGLRRRVGMTLLYNRFKNNIQWMNVCHDSHA